MAAGCKSAARAVWQPVRCYRAPAIRKCGERSFEAVFFRLEVRETVLGRCGNPRAAVRQATPAKQKQKENEKKAKAAAAPGGATAGGGAVGNTVRTTTARSWPAATDGYAGVRKRPDGRSGRRCPAGAPARRGGNERTRRWTKAGRQNGMSSWNSSKSLSDSAPSLPLRSVGPVSSSNGGNSTISPATLMLSLMRMV